MAIGSTKSVLILGAGASKASDFELPTMSNFFETDLDQYPELAEFLRSFYPNRDLTSYNLEEILAHLELSRVRLRLWGYDSQYGDQEALFEACLDYVKERLKIPEEASCCLHKRLFSRLDNRDSILTINYDLVADQSLLEVEPTDASARSPAQNTRMGKLEGLLRPVPHSSSGSQPPTLVPWEEKWGFYIKLHGSLDWLYCPTPGCPNNVNVLPLSVFQFLEGQHEGKPCRCCGAPLQLFLIPPVATKRMEDRGRMAFLWNLAFREIRSADRLIVVGLSLAPTDFELRWLLREGTTTSEDRPIDVDIVNPDESHRQNLEAALGAYHRFHDYETIEEYLSAHKSISV